MLGKNLAFGKLAESQAQKFLRAQGYKILEVNYRTKFSEIDIIAQDQDVICFVEVKARHSLEFGTPEEAVSVSKQKQIIKSAFYYLKVNRFLDRAARFDVLTFLYTGEVYQANLIKNAFGLTSNF